MEVSLGRKSLGIDLGYGFVKGTDGERDCLFPSVVGLGQPLSYQSDLGDRNQLMDNLVVSVGGRRYFVGDLARRQSEIAARSLDPNRVQDKNVKVLLLAALGIFASEPRQAFNVVTGLPTNYYASYREGLAEALRGAHEVTMHEAGSDRDLVVDVDKVKIVPQPFGTLFDQVLDDGGRVVDQELAKAKVGIIDIGFKTADFAVADAMEFIDRLSTSTTTGMASAYGIIASKLREIFAIDKENYELDQIVERGEIRIAGKSYDLTEFKKETLEWVAAKVITVIDSLWDYRDLDKILITGGGGQVLGQHLVPEFPNAVIVDGAQMANARGFYKLSKKLFKNDNGNPFIQ
ncbi:MAG: ParM/StbA family protein [Bacillota bacterium]